MHVASTCMYIFGAQPIFFSFWLICVHVATQVISPKTDGKKPHQAENDKNVNFCMHGYKLAGLFHFSQLYSGTPLN